jgi:hypothetical protein
MTTNDTLAERGGWQSAPATGLEEAIARFKADLPGWWFTIGECQVSCDASCAPTDQSEHVKLCPTDRRFDEGFHVDLPQPSSMAEALEYVRRRALAALERAGTGEQGQQANQPHNQEG